MSAQILELYPHTGTMRELDGTYLAHDLRSLGTSEQPFVYANFVSSLDGRIAVVEAHTGESYVLEDLTSSHDWRLFQELQAQADCMVTHGGYLRALAARRFEDILQVGLTKQALDIGRWRNAHGLTRQPAIAIVSRTLDFPIPRSLERHEQPVDEALEASRDIAGLRRAEIFDLLQREQGAADLRDAVLERKVVVRAPRQAAFDIAEHGQDMPDIRNWKWPGSQAQSQ